MQQRNSYSGPAVLDFHPFLTGNGRSSRPAVCRKRAGLVLTALCLLAALPLCGPFQAWAESDQLQYSVDTVHQEETSPLGGCTVSVDKPVIAHASTPMAEAMNGAVDALYVSLELPTCEGYVDDTTCLTCIRTAEVTFTAHALSPHLLGLDIWRDFYGGGPHPVAARRALNFDPDTGQRLQLSDLLKPGWEMTLDPIIAQRLSEGYGQVNYQGVSPEQFLLTEEGLVFFFNPYEIASYAQGAPEALFTYQELEDFVRPDGPLGAYLTAGSPQ